MKKSAGVAWIALVMSLPVGCGGSDSPSSKTNNAPTVPRGFDWDSIQSAVGFVVENLHYGTGWILNKSQVSVSKVGEVRGTDPDGYVADFRISVSKNENTFDTVAKNVPCDSFGIPTESSVGKLGEAVEDIKAKIKKFQK